MREIEAGWDVAVGSRRHENTTTLVKARWFRELGGRFVNWLTHLVLLGHFRDTQCGIKGFRGDIGRVVFERCRIDGFAFDVEVFLIAEQDRLSLTEIPVSVENRKGSTVRLVQDTVKLFGDLVKLRRAAGWGWYIPNTDQQQILERRTGAVRLDRRRGVDRRARSDAESIEPSSANVSGS
jgi:dolichyl-phosphate beta-glucosyltransferase